MKKPNKWERYEQLKSQIKPDQDYEEAIRAILRKLKI